VHGTVVNGLASQGFFFDALADQMVNNIDDEKQKGESQYPTDIVQIHFRPTI
jgi:hypothetical protein